MSSSTCAQCHQPLEVEIGPDEDSDIEMDASFPGDTTQTFPDDVRLSCGCHFHWECLLAAYELDKCPNCGSSIVSSSPVSQRPVAVGGGSASSASDTPTPRIVVDLTNEGGHQPQIDIFPILKEESYLRAYPEERKARAFLEFCREGDHRAIVDLLHSCSPSEDNDITANGNANANANDDDTTTLSVSPDTILRYQDPINEMESGLHAAAANGNREVAWLLLLLASQYPELDIPALVFQEAATLGVMREEQAGKVDLRSLRDAKGRTAEDVAREVGVVWNGWIGNARLAMP